MDLRFPALIATSFVGFVLTGATLFVTVFGKVSQLGHRNSLLSCVSFLLWSNLFWSLWVFLISIENLYAPHLQNGTSGFTFCHISAGIINGFIPWLWGGNLLLAIQRYYTNKYDKELPPRVFWGVFCGVITASGIALGINLADVGFPVILGFSLML
ncbi:hypothetical protein BC830DRAFT_1154585 [Chytriomyces sp. MP71]|nr:hypothetical protein BC830DRAFT_1154585 [Chytriomyces sp. MP71]